MDLIKQPIGNEGELSIMLAGGKLVIQLAHAHASGSVLFTVEQDAGYFIDKLAEAIPGVMDDALLALIKEAIQKL